MKEHYKSLTMYFVLFFIFISCKAILAQAPDTLWTRTFGGGDSDEGYSVQQTTDGGYILTGYTQSFGSGSRDVWLIRTTSSGDTLWTRTFGGVIVDEGYSVQQTTDGGYILTGYTASSGSGSYDLLLIRTDSFGDALWTRTFGGIYSDRGYSVQQTTDAGYILTGGTASFGSGGLDVWLIRTDSSGETLWTKTFGGSGYDCGHSVQQTTDGGYILTGITESFGSGSSDVWLIRTDCSGETLWTKTFGGSDSDWGKSVQQTTDGGYILIGSTKSFGLGSRDFWLIRTDSSGDILWTRTFGGVTADEGESVQQTTDGGYILTGGTYSFGSGGADVLIIRTDSYGDTLWTSTFGGSGNDCGYSVQQTTDGGYILTGRTYSFGLGNGDVWLIKLGSDSISNPRIISATPGHQQVNLRWSQNTEPDLHKYNIYRDTLSTAITLIDSCVATSPPDTFYIDTGLTNGKIYYYRVKAVDTAGNESGYSNEVNATPNGPPVWSIIPDTCFAEDSSLSLSLNDYVYDDSDSDDSLTINISEGIKINSDLNPITHICTFSTYPDSSGFTEQFIVTATDPGGLSSCDTFNVTVLNVNDTPILYEFPDYLTNEDYPFPFIFSVTDPDVEPMGYAILKQPSHGVITANVDTLANFTINNHEAGPATGNWMFDSDFTPFSEDGNEYSNYAYTGFQWNADGHGNGSCEGVNPGSGKITSSAIISENLDVLSDTSGTAVFLDELELTFFEHVNLINSDNPWSTLGEAGDRRLYSYGIGEIQVNGQTKLQVTDIVLRLTNYYPDPIGPGGESGYGLGIGFGIIDTVNSDELWIAEFDPNNTGLVEFNFESFSPTIQECYGAYDVVNISIKPVSGNQFIYTPDLDYFGHDEFTAIVFDGTIYSNTESGNINITSVEDAPIISTIPDTSFNEDEQLKFAISYFYDFVYDPDNADSTLTWSFSDTDYVYVTMDEDSVTLSSEIDWFGKDTLSAKVSDGEFSDETSFLITVHPVNDPPYFTKLMPDSISFDSNIRDTLLLTEFASDVDNPDSTLNWSYIQSSFVLCDINGTLNSAIFWVEENLSGQDTVVLSVSDGEFTVYDSLIVTVNPVTGIEYLMSQIPKEYSLKQNYPNPFNPTTTIIYGLPKSSHVDIRIYDLLGREVATLVNNNHEAKHYKVIWDAKDRSGNSVPSGMYLYRIVAKSGDRTFVKTRKLLLMR